MPEEMSHFRRHVERRRFQLISRLIPKGTDNVLEAGCGSGWLSEMLYRRGLKVTALDIGLDSLKRASNRAWDRNLSIPFVMGDIYHLPFDNNIFDTVVASEVLEHLERPADAIREINRVLRPGGYIILSTPYRERIQETLCIHCNHKTPVSAHLHSFDRETMTELLDEKGFTIQKSVTFTSRPAEFFGMAGLSSFLPYQGWRLLDKAVCSFTGRQTFMAVRAVSSG